MPLSPRLLGVAFCATFFLPNLVLANSNVYVSRFWHNHQPLYWPEWNSNGAETQRGQFAWDSIVLKPGQNYGGLSPTQHPENNLTEIFSINDRVNSYQSGPRNSLSGLDRAAGFALSYSGSLIDNVRQLGSVGQLGYGRGWNNGYKEARGWKTPSGSPRMDLVGFTYHHSLAPLLPKAVFRKELQIFKQAWWKAWGGKADLSDHSKGFFPTEMGYSRHLIEVLREEGYEWVIVASHHLSRTCPTYHTVANPEGRYNIFSSPPNKADQLGPSPTEGWWYGEPNPGNAAWNVAPYAYQLHRVKYVNPETGAETTMYAVPSDDVLSYRFGYASEGIGKIEQFIAPHATDRSRPVLVMPSTDGDNAWGGGSSSWFEATPQFFGQSGAAGYRPSAPQDFVNAAIGAAGGENNIPVVHIEDGAWIFPEMDYGSPSFLKWIEPPVATVANRGVTTVPGTQIDLETPGFALKFYSYAPLMAGANWCETAEQILRDEGGSVEAWKIQAPYDEDGRWNHPHEVELAWHIYLKGLDSGFNYYGGLGNDDEMKPGLATRRAVEKLTPWMTTARRNNDRTPPTVLKPQRFPYNPGAYTFGWFNQVPGGDTSFLKRMNSEFYIWTHAYDISGIPSGQVKLKVRIDHDGINPLASNQNETYAGGDEVGPWVTLEMTKRALPKTREALNAAAANSQIDYFLPVQPEAVADYYFVKITEANLPGFRSKLLDYYIEATDAKGNVSQSEIQHVWVDDFSGQVNGGGGGGPSGTVVTTTPNPPVAGQTVTVTYQPAGRNLAAASAVNLHHGFNGGNWTALPGLAMTKSDTAWTFAYPVPAEATTIALVFNNGAGTWDNNGGSNWNLSVTAEAPSGPPAASTGLRATAAAPNRVDLAWTAVSGAASYTIRRGGTQIGTSRTASYADTTVQPSTSYHYTVAAVNSAGDSAPSVAVSVTTPVRPVQPPDFNLAGENRPGYLLTAPGMKIHAAVRGTKLYVATWFAAPAQGNDHFIFVTDQLLASASAALAGAWNKAGQIAMAPSKPYLAMESANGYVGWTGAPASSTAKASSSGNIFEGVIDLAEAFGAVPATIYLAVAAIQTADNGVLAAQAPAAVTPNGNLEPEEFLALPLASIADTVGDNRLDRLDAARQFRVSALRRSGPDFVLELPTVPGVPYRVEYKARLTDPEWIPAGGLITGDGTAEQTLPVTRPEGTAPDEQGFFRVVADR